MDEASESLQSRYLVIAGIVSSNTLSSIQAGLPAQWPSNCHPCFVWYSYEDIPVGTKFDFVFLRTNPASFVNATTKIVAVTQQYAKPLDFIPHGWKTICLIEFPIDALSLIEKLSEIDTWDKQERTEICLATKETFRGLNLN